jgi:hypothetical protein
MELKRGHGVTDESGIKTAEDEGALQREHKVEESDSFGKVFLKSLQVLNYLMREDKTEVYFGRVPPPFIMKQRKVIQKLGPSPRAEIERIKKMR